MIEKLPSTYPITNWTKELLGSWRVPSEMMPLMTLVVELVAVLLFTYICQYLAKKIIVFVLRKITQLTKLKFASHLLDHRFPTFFALIAPLSWLRNSIPVVFELYPSTIVFLVKLSDIFIVLMIYWLVNAVLKAFSDYLNRFRRYKDKPIESYFQIVRIIVVIFLLGAFFTILTDTNIIDFFKAMGAASAVMMLVFKDSILGLVSSVQVTTNDMVRIGDWITIPQHQADGDVVQITLNTVKIQNFDKTITTVPTYSLISDSFQNWRGMQIAGGRRIKRAITIKQSSIRYVEENEISLFSQIQGITDYIAQRQEEINQHNEQIGADRRLMVNGRNMTNIGLYRAYAKNYLTHHPNVNHNMMIMARQLPPTEIGLPIEIYCFTDTTEWESYERIMADIFDHLIAAVPFFDLEIFERSSGSIEKIGLEMHK